MAKGFVYRGKNRTADDVTKKANEGSRDYDSIFKSGLPVFKPKEGENVVRVLPSTWEEPDWDLTVYSHYGIGPDNARYLCLEHTEDCKCPVCEARSETTDEEEKDALRTAKGAVCWVVDRDDEKAGPQLWPLPFTKVRNEIYARSIDRKTREAILIDDPEEGYDITFFRKGTGERTQYSGVEVARDPSPLSENSKTQQRWLDYISEHPLTECLNYYSYEHVKKALYGKATKKADDEDEAPRGRSRLAREDDEEDERSSRSSRRSRSADDEEDEKPSRSSRRASRDVDDEDEEEAPPSKSRSRAAKEDLDDEIPFDAKGGKVARRRAILDEEEEDEDEKEDKRSSRRSGKDAEEDEPEEEEDSPSSSARRQLSKLRPAGKRGR